MADILDIYLPTLHSFAMNNPFTGSCGALRFYIKPTVVKEKKDVKMEESSITAWYWHGPYCKEKSQMEGEQTFPMSEEGRLSLKKWLEDNI